MLACPDCPKRTFSTAKALHQHRSDSKGHFYCQPCMSTFPDRTALFDHATNVHSTTCGSCRRMFKSEKGVRRHLLDSPKHPKCRSCRTGFCDHANLTTHKAEVHGYPKAPKRNSWREQNQRGFSPTASITDDSLVSTQLLLSSLSSAASQGGFWNEMTQRVLAASPDHSSDVSAKMSPLPSLTDCAHPRDSLPRNEQLGNYQFDVSSSIGLQETIVRCGQFPAFNHDEASDLRCSATALANTRSDDHKQRSDSSKGRFVSPLLETNIPLPTESHSESSVDRPIGCLTEYLPDHRSPPQPRQPLLQDDSDDLATTSLTRGRTASQDSLRISSSIVDTMRAACRARCSEVARSASPRRLSSPSRIKTVGAIPWLSRLPTIVDETDMEHGYEPECPLDLPEETPAEIPSEPQDLPRPSGLRKRRLSLSPTLPSIPEAVHIHEIELTTQIVQGDSDSDGSQGIHELRGGDFLFDSLSENEYCQTPMTYLTAEESEFEIDVKRHPDYPSSPTLLVEDLTGLVDELCSPSSADGGSFDPNADPFELHPSANNSPMSATFPKRLRAWSLSDAPYDPKFLSPSGSRSGSGENGSRNADGKPGDDVKGQNEGGVEEPDKVAIAADEPVPRAIEEDLFSEPDETMEPISHADDTTVGAGEARFAEEGHPLQSIISLNTLPLSAKSPNSVEASSHSRSPLRCRLCQSDPCRDITATFCGHLFCNECITQAVIAKAKCPVCISPTLLYCLFRLDLST